MEKNQDKIFAEPIDRIADFKFDDQVADVFSDMISRSVPGYDALLPFLELFTAVYLQKNTRCYDLGCSLGAGVVAISRGARHKKYEIIAVDNSQAMIRKCRSLLVKANLNIPVNLICADINDIHIENASLVLMNFTLQFITKEKRSALIKKIYDGILPGGIFILSEKIEETDAEKSDFITGMHQAFKKAHGYSKLEISRKRTALENVMIPDTEQIHHTRLDHAGFQSIVTWFRCFNFISMAAVK